MSHGRSMAACLLLGLFSSLVRGDDAIPAETVMSRTQIQRVTRADICAMLHENGSVTLPSGGILCASRVDASGILWNVTIRWPPTKREALDQLHAKRVEFPQNPNERVLFREVTVIDTI